MSTSIKYIQKDVVSDQNLITHYRIDLYESSPLEIIKSETLCGRSIADYKTEKTKSLITCLECSRISTHLKTSQ